MQPQILKTANPNEHVSSRSRVNVLYGFHNDHMTALMSHNINITRWSQMNQDDIAYHRQKINPTTNQIELIGVKIKHALPDETRKASEQLETCKAIEQLLESEGVPLKEEHKAALYLSDKS